MSILEKCRESAVFVIPFVVLFGFFGGIIYTAWQECNQEYAWMKRGGSAIEEYEFVKKAGGDPLRLCGLARKLVGHSDYGSAYRNLDEYKRWDAIARKDCGGDFGCRVVVGVGE